MVGSFERSRARATVHFGWVLNAVLGCALVALVNWAALIRVRLSDEDGAFGTEGARCAFLAVAGVRAGRTAFSILSNRVRSSRARFGLGALDQLARGTTGGAAIFVVLDRDLTGWAFEGFGVLNAVQHGAFVASVYRTALVILLVRGVRGGRQDGQEAAGGALWPRGAHGVATDGHAASAALPGRGCLHLLPNGALQVVGSRASHQRAVTGAGCTAFVGVLEGDPAGFASHLIEILNAIHKATLVANKFGAARGLSSWGRRHWDKDGTRHAARGCADGVVASVGAGMAAIAGK